MTETHLVQREGTAVLSLKVPGAQERAPAFTSADVLPGRGMMTLQIRARLPRLGEVELLAPTLAEARETLAQPPADFPANASYLIGGAVLLPFANRIRGRLSADGKTIAAHILDREVRLPANAGGRRPGAERYAMHGLMLDAPVELIEHRTQEGQAAVRGIFHAGDFGRRWLSKTEVEIENVLRSDSFTLRVTARNVGDETLPMGIGWHPYFAVPSGRRQDVRLRIPARRRALVNDYDEMLPTGEVVPLRGTAYDFSAPGGRPLDDLFLDDCFVDLEPSAEGEAVAEIIDAAASLGLRLAAASPPVRAFQVYAPPESAFVVVEPQLNWADPFGPQWGPEEETGMARLAPGQSVVYSARLELFTP